MKGCNRNLLPISVPSRPKLRIQKLQIFLICVGMVFIGVSCSSDSEPTPVSNELSITGQVTDQAGNGYENVSLNLSKEGATLFSAVSNEEGVYSLFDIPGGEYNLQLSTPRAAEAIGENPKSINILESEVETVDFDIQTLPVEATLTLAPTDLLGEISTSNNQEPSNPDDLLYAVSVFTDNNLVPITAPNGHHIKLDEWDDAEGATSIHCNGKETIFQFEFSGLIPNGVYTLWLAPYNPPAQMKGTGALGRITGVDNILSVDDQGNSEITVSMLPGSLSVFGNLGSCALTDNTPMLIVLDYHIDQQTHGASPGPDATEVSHMIFYF